MARALPGALAMAGSRGEALSNEERGSHSERVGGPGGVRRPHPLPLPRAITLTGHIDVLQIRNGRIHILDYKPGASHERPIAQIMVYALALSRRTGLCLYDFVCAWFDDQHYYEFYPLHVVHKRGKRHRRR
jgi:ATP-dependent exoDNAse (exonuclease V) beta subunit